MASAEVLERIYRLEVQAGQAVRQLTKINKSTKSISTGFRGIQRAAAAAFSVMSAFQGIKGIVEAEDQLTLLKGSFEALTGSASRAADLYSKVLGTVAETGASIKDAATTFQRLTIGLEELGATNDQIETVAQTFIKLGRVSGTSMFDTNAALVQFAQGLASGKLQGDELRSIMERLPLITKLIQEEWNKVNEGYKISRGDVKDLGRQGKLSAELIFNALISGSKLTAEQFANLTVTLEQETNKIIAQFTILQATFSEETGFGEGIKEGVRDLSSGIAEINTQLPTFIKDMKQVTLLMRDWLDLNPIVAHSVGVVLVGAVLAFSKALATFAKKHWIITLLTGLVTIVPIVIKEWDKISVYFQYRIPEAFYSVEVALLKAMQSISIETQRTFQEMKNSLSNTFREMVIDLNAWSVILQAVPGINPLDLDVPELAKGIKIVVPLLDEIVESQQKVNKAARQYGEALVDIENKANAAAEAQEKLKTVIKTTFGDDFKIGTVDTSLADDVYKFQQAVLDSLDPQRELNREIEEFTTLVKIAGGISEEQAALYIQNLKDAANQTKATTDGISDSLKDIKNAVDGFARDFTDELVEGLKTGEFAFKDFAASVIETLVKMALNPIFEKLFGIISGGISASFGYSSGAAGSSVGAGGAGTLAATTSGNSVGILTSPTYGFGTGKAVADNTGVTINVTNNSKAEVQASSSSSNGMTTIEMLIEDKINSSISSGGLDRSLQNNFGIRRLGF